MNNAVPNANIFAEPLDITLGNQASIAGDVFLHGPAVIGNHVGINHNVSIDGGRKGIHIGDHSRIASHYFLCALIMTTPDLEIHKQAVNQNNCIKNL